MAELDAEQRRQLGQRILGLRQEHRPRRLFVSKIGVTERTWGAWERGETVPNWDHLEALGDLFKVEPDWILYGDRTGTPDPFAQDGANPLEEVHRKLDEILRRLPTEPEIDEEIVDPALRPGGQEPPPAEEDLGEQAS